MIVLAAFAATAVLAFAVPLSLSIAVSRTQQLVLGRSGDADRFATLAEAAAATGDARELAEEAQRYDSLYGDGVLVLDSAGATLVNAGVDARDPRIVAALADARRNDPPRPPQRLVPWSAGRIQVARPIGTEAHVDGAVLIVASTGTARLDIAKGWAVVAVGAIIALALFLQLAVTLSRWVLRPLAAMSQAVAEVTAVLPRPRAGFVSPVRRRDGPPEIHSLMVAFDAMALAVSDSIDAQRQLVADTAHSMRNPLTALAIRLESLEPAVTATAMTTFRGATVEVERLITLLDGLLTLAVAETPTGFDKKHTSAVESESCDAVHVVAQRVTAWTEAYQRAGQTLRAEQADRAAGIAVPETIMSQILDVLLSNSCKHAGRGADTVVRVHHDGGGIATVVSDNGTGVADGELERLTTRFFRGAAAAAGGTGLGLPIAAALAKHHHGRLTVHATAPHGLTVRVALPAAART
jgi:signal transduction histidine kinase